MESRKEGEYISFVQKDEEAGIDLFEIRMLEHNQVYGLLPITLEKEDGKYKLYCSTAGLRSVSHVCETEGLKKVSVRRVLSQMVQVIRNMEECLLDCHHLNLQAEYIYQTLTGEESFFCYIPWDTQPFHEKIRDFSHWILEHVDYKEREDVVFGYQFQHFCDSSQVTPELLRQFLDVEESNMRKEGEDYYEEQSRQYGKFSEYEGNPENVPLSDQAEAGESVSDKWKPSFWETLRRKIFRYGKGKEEKPERTGFFGSVFYPPDGNGRDASLEQSCLAEDEIPYQPGGR